jgi:hypothetical protein
MLCRDEHQEKASLAMANPVGAFPSPAFRQELRPFSGHAIVFLCFF